MKNSLIKNIVKSFVVFAMFVACFGHVAVTEVDALVVESVRIEEVTYHSNGSLASIKMKYNVGDTLLGAFSYEASMRIGVQTTTFNGPTEYDQYGEYGIW